MSSESDSDDSSTERTKKRAPAPPHQKKKEKEKPPPKKAVSDTISALAVDCVRDHVYFTSSIVPVALSNNLYSVRSTE